MIVYIAGKITGDPDYREKFHAAEVRLRERGYTVLNPAVLPEGLTYEAYMRICLPMLEEAEAVYLLRGWRDSVGACTEQSRALQLGKLIWYEGCTHLPGEGGQSLWAPEQSLYITNPTHPIIRQEYENRLRELGKRYDEPMSGDERRQFDRDMLDKYREQETPPGWVEWRLKIWEFTPTE